MYPNIPNNYYWWTNRPFVAVTLSLVWQTWCPTWETLGNNWETYG